MKESITSKNREETKEIAKNLYKKYGEGKIWLLYGDLGSGKTVFTKGLGEAHLIDESKIKSPTFTFVSEFDRMIHYDLYRLEKPDDSLSELLREHLKTGKTIVIEWPQVIEKQIKNECIKISFTHLGEDTREIVINPPLF